MELRDLEYFAVVARLGSVRRASDELELSPPAVTKSLRRLEASVSAKLVQRSTKGIVLTSAGRVLLARITRLRLALDDVKREAVEVSLGRAGNFGVGVGQVDAETVTAACAVLLKDSPNLSIEIVVSNNDVMVAELRQGKLDLIVNVLPASPFAGTIQEQLFVDEVAVCAAQAHRLAGRRAVPLAELAKERWALGHSDNFIRERLERAFAEHRHPPPNLAVVSRSVKVRLAAVARSNALGIFSRRMLKQAAGLRLARLPVRELTWETPVGAIYREDGYVPAAARRLIDLLKPIH